MHKISFESMDLTERNGRATEGTYRFPHTPSVPRNAYGIGDILTVQK